MAKEQRDPSMIAPASPSPDIWNPDVALKRMDNDLGLLTALVEYFFEDAPVLMNELPLAISRTDSPEATRAVQWRGLSERQGASRRCPREKKTGNTRG